MTPLPSRRALCAGLALLALAPAAGAIPLKLPNFPLRVEGPVRSLAVADLDGDGAPDLLVQHGEQLTAFSGEGKKLKGWPVGPATLNGAPAGAPPAPLGGAIVGLQAVGDVDGDKIAEVALCLSGLAGADARLVVLRADGTLQPGFPVAIPRGTSVGPSLVDLDGNGAAEVVAGARSGALVAVTGRGQPAAGFPLPLGSEIASTVSSGRLTSGAAPALAAGTVDGKLHLVLADGSRVRGFPVATGFTVSGAPAFADLDDDGANDLLFASQDFKVYAVRADGSPLPGFPINTGYRIYGGPAPGDLDGDGRLEVVVGAGDGKVHAWTAAGKPVPGFPVSAGPRLAHPVLLADVDRDRRDEVFVANGDALYGWKGNGRPVEDFPLRANSDQLAPPVLADLVRDAAVELVLGGMGEVQGMRMPREADLPVMSLSWPAAGHDAARQGRYGPCPGRYKNLQLGPPAPRHGDALALTYEFVDLDGDPEPATRIRWVLDDKPVPELDGKKDVPGTLVRKGGRWKALLQTPEDWDLHKDGPGSRVAASPVVVVGNTPPGAPKVAIAPAKARTDDDLSVKILEDAPDVDGDKPVYKQRWYRNGDWVADRAVIPANVTKKGERWTVVVTPNDGTDDGPHATAELVLLNTQPEPPQIALVPETPRVETDIVVRIAKPATDADADPLAYRYTFFLNGQRRALPPGRPMLPAGSFRRGDVVAVEVRALDDEEVSAPVRAEIKVVNSPPEAPKAAIAPEKPGTEDELTAGLVGGARDPDGDPVHYRIQWSRNGEKFGAPGLAAIGAEETKKGDRWAVEIVPSDDQLEGPAGRAEVVVGNSPPTPPRLVADRPRPAADESVFISFAEKSRDPDGDAVNYEYQWLFDGKPAAFPTDKVSLAPGEFKKNQRIVVRVSPSDSDGGRGKPGTVEIRPRNSPPGACRVAFPDKEPTAETGIRTAIVSQEPDKDADPITYHYRWYRDGVLVPEHNDKAALKPGEVRRGEDWRVVALPFDGEDEGPAAEAWVLVGDVAPLPPKVALRPAKPTVLTGISCDIVEPAKDPDGDPLTLEYRWTRDGAPFPLPLSASAVPGGALRAGQAWRCEVSAYDGRFVSPPAVAAATVENAPPTVPTVGIEPAEPHGGDELVCAVSAEAIDPDGDRVAYDFRWTPPAGLALPALEDPARIPGALVRKGHAWKCEVGASDGKARVSAAAAAVQVRNTPPRPPRARLLPVDAVAGTELRCEISSPALDPDGDKLGYAFGWLRNDERQSFAETSSGVPGRMVKPGDRWRCFVSASDGEAAGTAARSPEVRVRPAPAAAPASAPR